MVELVYTPIDEIPIVMSLLFVVDPNYNQIRDELRAGFNSGKLNSLEYRKYQLLQLGHLVEENAALFEEALRQDLGRPLLESRFMETNSTVGDVLKAYHNVEKWAKPETPSFDINFFAMKPRIHKVPKGVVLNIVPFNYPLWLTVGPIAGALASGNAILVKLPESTPAVSTLIAELVPRYMDRDLVRVVNGAIPETTKVLELQWDHILYTGSGRVGKIVATAAAKHLTPVTLELGGKSPVIVDSTCNLPVAAKRILWGKVMNAGQTCVAPDYVLVPRASTTSSLKLCCKRAYREFFPDNAQASQPGNYARIVTAQAFDRCQEAPLSLGGEMNAEAKYIAPTIVTNVAADDSLMSDEIFGPLLPIVAVDDIDEAIRFVKSRDHPLALYLFTQDEEVKKRVFSNTQSGGFACNEVVILPGVEGLPFGGTGPSGYGAHTGKFTFDMFTHFRASMDSPSWLESLLKFRYPPYTEKKLKATDGFKKKLPPQANVSRLTFTAKWFLIAFAVALAAGFSKRARGLIAVDLRSQPLLLM
ncbi:aldehyde dehydrogenase [Coprinopsis sp. MPI-PUGE-AT-0042]|nr:aldehyde dehydrogenase [Coprinopsis sp. MPI-PUGE-AT-0042]